jgi:hypothetical protein
MSGRDSEENEVLTSKKKVPKQAINMKDSQKSNQNFGQNHF